MPGERCELTVHGDRAVIDVAGELDIAQADRLRSVGESALSDGLRAVEIDLSDVTFIDSTAIGAIVHLNNLAAQRNTALTLRKVTPAVRRLLEFAGLGEVFRKPDGEARRN